MIHLLLIGGILAVVVLSVLVDTEVHQCLHSLLALRCLRLHFVQWVVQNLPIVAAELAHLSKVYVDHLTFVEQFSDNLEDVEEHSLESSFVNLDVLGHGSEVGPGDWCELDAAEVSHFWLVL